MSATFDECVQLFPESSPPDDFHDFWKSALQDLKKIPVQSRHKLILKKSLGRETRSEVFFQSYGNFELHGLLSVPRTRGKCPLVVSFHDLLTPPELQRAFTDEGIAHLSMAWRFQSSTNPEQEDSGKPDSEPNVTAKKTEQTPVSEKSPTTVTRAEISKEEILQTELKQALQLDDLYKNLLFQSYLDAVRATEFARLQKGVDYNRIALYGQGLGCALAIFVANHRQDSIRAMALERLSFIWLERWLHDSKKLPANIINKTLTETRKGKSKLKKNLRYLDLLPYAENIKSSVLATVSLEDSENPPTAAFGFFNKLCSEKNMHLFPEARPDMDKETRNACVEFLISSLKK